MTSYIAKRVLLFVPTLFLISLITFYLATNAPGDPVEIMLDAGANAGLYDDKAKHESDYRQMRHQLGLDLPLFYFSFSTLAADDYLHLIDDKAERDIVARLIDRYGNRQEISRYYESFKEFERSVPANKDLPVIKEHIASLFGSADENLIRQHFEQLQILTENAGVNDWEHKLKQVQNNYAQMLAGQTPWKNYIPCIHFYGLHNQYHQWIKRLIRGDFGNSYRDKRPVASVLLPAMKTTLFISLMSILLTYLLAIPLGVFSAVNRHHAKGRIMSVFLFALFSMPGFWTATLLIIFFGGGDYLDWFPPYGLSGLPAGASVAERLLDNAYHLVLPLTCWVYPNIAFLSFQMRGGMLDVLGQEFIKTARAKGLPESRVIWKHSFRNSLLPVITLLARVFPLAVSGSVILENIFSIPGMGKLAYEALVARDYPVIFSVMMIVSALTMLGFLVSDILYAWIEPRIRYKKSG